LNNNSFNNFNKNKKKIRLVFNKSTEAHRISDNLSFSKKLNKKPKQMKNTNINTNTNRYYHYKSRSLMDIDNPHNFNNYQKIENYTITENRKMENNFSLKCFSAKNATTRNNNSIKQRKKVMNISFLNLPTYANNNSNNNNKQFLEPKKYKGPIDLKCLLYTKNINVLIEKIMDLLKKNKMNVIYIGYHKLRCTKNCQSYDIEFFELSENTKNIKQYNINSSNINSTVNYSNLYENDSNLKTISGYSNYKSIKDKSNNIYYYTITSKVCNNKKLMKIISKIIYSKFNILQIKKGENRKHI
jgi:hypothetical protein